MPTYYRQFTDPVRASEYAAARRNLGHNVRRVLSPPGRVIRVYFSPGRLLPGRAIDVQTIKPAEVGRK